jgi:hypothetical protein
MSRLSRLVALAAAGLLFTLPASAQEPSGPQTPARERVEGLGKREHKKREHKKKHRNRHERLRKKDVRGELGPGQPRSPQSGH